MRLPIWLLVSIATFRTRTPVSSSRRGHLSLVSSCLWTLLREGTWLATVGYRWALLGLAHLQPGSSGVSVEAAKPAAAPGHYLPQSCWPTRREWLSASGRRGYKPSACTPRSQPAAEPHYHRSSTTGHQWSSCNRLREKVAELVRGKVSKREPCWASSRSMPGSPSPSHGSPKTPPPQKDRKELNC